MIASRAWADSRARSTLARSAVVSDSSSTRSSMPMIPFMGVRISWLMLARNSDFRRDACSACSREATSACSATCRSLTSRRMPVKKRWMPANPSPQDTSSARVSPSRRAPITRGGRERQRAWPAAQVLLERLDVALPFARRRKHRERLAHHLRRRIAEHSLRGRVGEHDAAAVVHGDDRVGRGVGEQPVLGLADRQRLVCFGQQRRVAAKREQPHQLSRDPRQCAQRHGLQRAGRAGWRRTARRAAARRRPRAAAPRRTGRRARLPASPAGTRMSPGR